MVLVIVIGIVLAAGGLGFGLAWKAGLIGKPGKGPGDGTTTNGTQPQPPPSDGTENGEVPPLPPEIPADWKTYTSEKYGYSVKYPPDWDLAPEPHADFNARSPQGGMLQIVDLPGLDLQFPEEFFADQIAAPIERFRQINVGGKVVMRSKTTTLAYLSVTPSLVLLVEYYREGYPYSEIEESNFDLILGSFKFE